MLVFLEKMKSGNFRPLVTACATEIVVTQFRNDLLELCIVRDLEQFKAVKDDGYISDAITAEEYVARVFDPDVLPTEISTKSYTSCIMKVKLTPSSSQFKLKLKIMS